MKEELTTKMHSEFQVDAETEIKHKVWALLSECARRKLDPERQRRFYGLTAAQVERYKDSYLALKR